MNPFEVEALQSVILAISSLGGLGMVLRFSLRKRELDMRRRELEARAADPALTPGAEAMRQEIAGLRSEHAQLEAQVVELQERLDFTERLLAKGRPPQAV